MVMPAIIEYPDIEERTELKTITFTGAAGLGAVGYVPLFTVTGDILLRYLLAWCSTTLTEALATATIALGLAGATTFFNAATTATDLVGGDFWYDATPTETIALAVPSGFKDIHVRANIVGTVAAQAVNGGVLNFYAVWRRVSSNGLLVPA